MRVEHAGLASIFDPGGEIIVKLSRAEAKDLAESLGYAPWYTCAPISEGIRTILAQLEENKR